MEILNNTTNDSFNGSDNNQEITNNEQIKSSNDTAKYLKLISSKINEDIEDEDNNEPFIIKIKEHQNTCSEEYALNNKNYNEEENLVIDLLFNSEYDLDNDGKINETEIELAETILKSYDDNKSILDLILENINTCSTTYWNIHRHTCEQEGLTYVGNNFNDEYDLNKDGKITTEDYNFAKDIIQRNNKLKKLQNETLINSLYAFPNLISDSLDNVINNLNNQSYLINKNLYFREVVMRLIVNKEWVDNDIQFKYIIQSCIKKANMLADEVFKNT